MRAPLLPLFLACVAGAAVAVCLPPVTTPWLAAGAVAAWQCALLAFVAGRPRLCAGAVLASVALASATAAAHEDRARRHAPVTAMASDPFARPSGDAIVLEGVLTADAALRDTSVGLRIAVDRARHGRQSFATRGGVALTVTGAVDHAAAATWTRGRRVRVPATLRRPARYLNDGVADAEALAAWRGLALVGTVKSASLVEIVERAPAWEEWLARVRARVRRALHQAMPWDREAAGVATAILIGDRAGLDDAVERRLQRAGTYHVIAISGGNVALFATLAWTLARVCFGARRPAILAAIAIVVLYGLLVGSGASVGRAVLAAVVLLIAAFADHRAPPFNVLAVVGVTFLVWDPLALIDIGFLLSFGATAGILLAMPVWLPAVERRVPPGESRRAILAQGAALACVAIVLASMAAEVALLPVQAVAFQRMTLAGTMLNLVAIPAMAVVQMSGMAVVGLDLAGLEGLRDVAARLCAFGARALVDSARLVDVVPSLSWRVAAPPAGLVVTYLTAWAAVVCIRRTGVWRGAVAAACLAGVAMACSVPARFQSDAHLHVTMFDVGQAEAISVRLPTGQAWLVDAAGTGGTFDIGDRVLVPALLGRGITRLDALLITHADADHAGGAAAVIADLGPRRLFEGIAPARDEVRDGLMDAARRAGLSVEALRAGGSITRGDVVINVLHPPPPDWERQRTRNDDSVVLEVVIGDVAVILAGDVGESVEREIATRLTPDKLRVLKVAHHGSRSSTARAFVDAVAPAAAIISAGRGNMYGHPHPTVVSRLERAGVAIFRTDRDGQIDIATDGRVVDIRTWSRRRWRASARSAVSAPRF